MLNQERYLVASATTHLLRALDRDVMGMKIPDIAVDGVVYELSHLHSSTLKAIIILINNDPAMFAKRAYQFWRSGKLSLLAILNDMPEKSVISKVQAA